MNLAIFGNDYIYNEENIREKFLSALFWINMAYNIERCYIFTETKFDQLVCKEIKRVKDRLPNCKIVYSALKKDESYDEDLFDEAEYIDTKTTNEELMKIRRNEYIVCKSDVVIVYDSEVSGISPSLIAGGIAWMLNKRMCRIGPVLFLSANFER